MKALILSRFVKEYEPVRLAEEARKLGLEVDVVKYGQISLGVEGNQPVIDLGRGRTLTDYGVIVPRAASKKGSSLVGIKDIVLREAQGKRILNGESFAKYPLLGKMEQGVMLAKAGLPTVDFVTFGSKIGWREFSENPRCEFPCIIKGRFGSHGRTVKLVNDWEEFKEAFAAYKEGSVLVQPQVKVRQWYRCIVVGKSYLGQMRHRQKEKYGGEEGKFEKRLPQEMETLREICLKAAALFECDYAGLDVVWDERARDWKILEVNRTAQFKYFEKRTGVNVAEEIIRWVRE